MSRLAREERAQKRRWAEPGSRHDTLVRVAKWVLPAAFVAMLLILAFAPFSKREENTFILDKTEVAQAEERMRVEKARYRGEDGEGRKFLIVANEAVQETSRVPIVNIRGMAARLETRRGPLIVLAPRSRYDIEDKRVAVPGPLRISGPDGYRLDTADVELDLDAKTLRSNGAVTGATRLGTFEAGGLSADLDARTVSLTGRARLKIAQGAVR
ncbi:LPS export ABC transporter periplasmic protein LptC [Sphingomicrobium astaxanthinifaciens]|uniref:LPS export ABC transporter periplasmic protein LptC n=1 Tax=Sphingomicrobium astaxanthinifaciens TaxID=1227949 RepID=UPI001FCB5E68|nr:LPS export ABC transporter periplasmic protein LptC [Sphingomicrobium astaxanthinifaciens]MCJ7421112.1 LPS export ABC transporter periplasmic protein LptC [Sphingomicrobium astaxanthinifaciens]